MESQVTQFIKYDGRRKNVQDDKLQIIQSKQMAPVKDKGPALSSSSECMLTAGVAWC